MLHIKTTGIFLILLFFFNPDLYCQSLEVVQSESLNFGEFTNIGSGNITLGYNDNISTSGNVILLGANYHSAALRLAITAQRTVSIYFLPGQMLKRTGGTETMAITIGPSDRRSSFIALPLPAENIVKVGGIINVGSPFSTPPGAYTGQFEVEFTIEN